MPHRPREGRRARTPRERERTHTQRVNLKLNQTEPRNAQTAWNGVPAGEDKGHPDETTRHTQRGERRDREGGTGEKQEPALAPNPQTCRERRTHTTRALHLPRQ